MMIASLPSASQCLPRPAIPTPSRRPPSHFPFSCWLLAVRAGVFTVSGIIDATVYHGQQAIKKKLELGKLS